MSNEADEIYNVLLDTIPVMLTLFTLVLALLAHNIVRFMCVGDSLRNLNVAYFYFLVFVACCFRIACQTMILLITREGAESGAEGIPTPEQKKVVLYTNSLASYAELLIGVQQTGSMAELYLMIKQTTLALQYDQEMMNPQQNAESFLTVKRS